MADDISGPVELDEDIFTFDVSDDALEHSLVALQLAPVRLPDWWLLASSSELRSVAASRQQVFWKRARQRGTLIGGRM